MTTAIRFHLALLFTLGISLWTFSGLQGQLQVTNTNSGITLANQITGTGVVLSNVQFNCPNDAAGTFVGTNSNIGLADGILLTSGQAQLAIGPNSSGSTGFDNQAPGDPDLTIISGVQTFDACVLEFDLEPFCDTIQIKYVFGSDEYDEFVCGTVNDAFAFLISGPGYPVPTNIALIPGTTTPVSINTVNNGSSGSPFPSPNCDTTHSAYFTTNNVGVTIEYDGFTVVMTAKAPVQACNTYHLKLAIADGGDGIYDSGVFLELDGIGCTTNPSYVSVSSIVNDPVSTVLVEDCIDGAFIFDRGGDTTVAASFPYTIGGTAANGIDYNPALSGTVNFPANSSQVILPISALGDGLTEGLESIIVVVTDSLCFGVTADTAILEIEDIPPSDAGPDLVFCAGDAGQLAGVLVPTASHEWTPATGLSDPLIHNPTVTHTVPGTYQYIFNVSLSTGCVAVDTMEVEVLPRPIVTTSNDTSFCEGEGGVLISAGVTFVGTGSLYYTWWCDSTNTFCGIDSIYDNDPVVNPDTSTWYYVQVIAANGCLSNLDSVFVTVLPKPLVDLGPDKAICPDSAPGVLLGATITNASGPYTYDWTPGLGLNDSTIANPYARPDTTTIYTLIVTGGNGCTSDYTTLDTNSTVTVVVNPLPIAVAHQPAPEIDLCLNDSVQLQGAGFGAGPVYDFDWSPITGLNNPNLQSPMASPSLTTEYILTVWSNGCPSYGDTVLVNVHSLPSIEAGPDVEICLGETGQLDGEATGGGSAVYDFQWTPIQGIVGSSQVENPMVSPESTTVYYLQAITEWGCSGEMDSATVYLKPSPIAEAGPNLVICDGESIALQGSYSFTTTPSAPANQVYFSWSPNQSLSSSTIGTPTASPSESIYYYLEVTHNTCTTHDSMLLTVLHQPVAVVEADTNIICEGDSVQLTATGGLGGALYTWTPADGLSDANIANPVASPATSTLYTVTVSESACNDAASVEVEVIPIPVAAFVQSQIEGCAPFTVNFLELSSDSYNWIWNFGDGDSISNVQNPEHEYSSPGSYTVGLTAVGPGGCSSEAPEVQIQVMDAPSAEFGSDPAYPVELMLPLTTVQFNNLSENSNIFHWTFGDGLGSDVEHPTHDFNTPGTYYVKLVAQNQVGCTDTVTHGPYVVMIPELFIPNVFSPNGDGVNDVFQVEYSGSQPYVFQVFDRWGNVVMDTKNKNSGWKGTDADGNNLPESTFFYRVKVGEKEYTGQLTLVR